MPHNNTSRERHTRNDSISHSEKRDQRRQYINESGQPRIKETDSSSKPPKDR